MATIRVAAVASGCRAALLHSRRRTVSVSFPVCITAVPSTSKFVGVTKGVTFISEGVWKLSVRPGTTERKGRRVMSSSSGGVTPVTPRSAHGSALENRELLIQHLLVKDDQLPLLLELQKRIMQDGEDLSDLATEHSVCPSSSSGGMIGWIARGRTVQEFEEAAFNAPLNKITRVKTKHGWHLLQVLAEREEPKLEQIQVEDFASRIQTCEDEEGEELQLIDVREVSEVDIASIEGFKTYPLSQFGQWAPNIKEELDPEKETYVLCHHGMRSQQAAEWLRSQGFKRLYNIVGGIDAYSRKVDENVPRY